MYFLVEEQIFIPSQVLKRLLLNGLGCVRNIRDFTKFFITGMDRVSPKTASLYDCLGPQLETAFVETHRVASLSSRYPND